MALETDPRKERAQATRRRMVEAAYKLFSEQGWGVPLTAIAAEAGVAVQTIYFTFHTKVELLQAALQLAVLGDELPLAPHQRPWFHAMVDEADARKAIAMVVENTLPIFGRVAPLSGIFRSGEPEVAAMWAHSEKLRVDGYRILMEAVARKGPLKVGLDEAVETLFVLMSPDLYWKAVSDRGWPPERWRRWLTDLLVDALLA
jgi:AcrR family transcriptional regulator